MPNLKCKICGTEFPPIRERHYISRDLTKTGLAAAFGSSDEPAMFDSYDCPCCGSQVIAQPRKRQFDPKSEEATDEDLLADMSNETIAEHLGLNPAMIGHLRAAQSSSSGAEIYKYLDNALHFNTRPPCECGHTSFVKPMKKPSSLYFDNPEAAWAAVSEMRQFIQDNGFISIAKVDEILGKQHHITSKWGWTDLDKMRVVEAGNCSGYYISFPAICDRPELKEGSNEL